MPRGDDLSQQLIHAMTYGEPKTRKTWWALRAAEAGFNVLHLCGDPDGANVIVNLPPEARQRIWVVNCHDKPLYPVFAPLMVRFLKGMVVTWDDTDERILIDVNKEYNSAHACLDLRALSLCPTDVLIIDGWTSLAESIVFQWYFENGQDITAGKRIDLRDLYGWAGNVLSWIASTICNLNCHTIVICHKQTVDIMRKVPTDAKDRKGQPIPGMEPVGEQKIVPISSSRPHAEKLAGKFGDIFDFQKSGKNIYIDCDAEEGRDGGSRLMHGRFLWEQFQFGNLIKALGKEFPPGNQEMPGVIYYPPNAQTQEQADVEVAPMNDPTLDAQATGTLNLSGIANMGKGNGTG